MTYIPPKRGLSKFTCPLCGAIAKQSWRWLNYGGGPHASDNPATPLATARCDHCEQYSVWVQNTQIFPDSTNAPAPNPDLPEEVKRIYLEAGSISSKSPRGASALLRLGVQMLCKELGEAGKNINDDIAGLVKKGLPERVQKSLDCVRVIGNNAVHPGQIDTDDPEVVSQLFAVINLIAEYMITMPNRVNTLYSSLPQKDRDNIEKRDK